MVSHKAHCTVGVKRARSIQQCCELSVLAWLVLLLELITMAKTYKPGETVPKSAQAEMVGPRGGETGIERTVVKGEPFPPTLLPGQRYKIVDPTKTRGK